MHDAIAQILGYLRGMWRFRWWIFVVAWPVFIAGWIYVYSMPDQYQASARVYVDTQSVLRPLLRGLAVELDVSKQIAMINQTLLSRPNVEKIARMSDLDLEAKTPEDMDLLVSRLTSQISVVSGRGNNLYSLEYRNENPQKAKQVVQSVLTVFVENTLGDKRRDTDSAQRFLDEQIKEYEQRLFEAEERLKEFKRKNIGMMPSSGGDYYNQLQAAMGELKNIELLKKEAERRRDELVHQLEDAEDELEGDSLLTPTPATGSDPAIDARIQNLETKLDELLLQYTDNHPDVIAIKRTIEQLQKRKAENQAAKVDSPSNPAVAQNPVVQQLKLALGEAEANVGALSVRVEEYQRRVKQLQQRVDTIPAVEAEFKRLNRDYGVTKRNYDQLLARRESAKLSEDAEQSSENVKFRVVDPPFVGNEPVAPNRPIMVSVALLISIGAGLAFAFFMSQIKPTFDSTRQLSAFTNLPVFGAVGKVRTPKEARARVLEVSSFIGVGVLMLISYVIVLIMQAQLRSLFAAAGIGG